jgi:hypothetical protein
VQVGLHDDREQGLVDPAAAFQQRGEERAGAQLGDPQLQVTGRGRQHPRAMAVALPLPIGSALMWRSADHGRELGLDQRLVDRLGGLADTVINVRGLECIKDFQQCRLVKGHRALCPFARTIGVGLADHRTVAAPTWSPTPSRPATYTTSWDATLVAIVGQQQALQLLTQAATLRQAQEHGVEPCSVDLQRARRGWAGAAGGHWGRSAPGGGQDHGQDRGSLSPAQQTTASAAFLKILYVVECSACCRPPWMRPHGATAMPPLLHARPPADPPSSAPCAGLPPAAMRPPTGSCAPASWSEAGTASAQARSPRARLPPQDRAAVAAPLQPARCGRAR